MNSIDNFLRSIEHQLTPPNLSEFGSSYILNIGDIGDIGDESISELLSLAFVRSGINYADKAVHLFLDGNYESIIFNNTFPNYVTIEKNSKIDKLTIHDSSRIMDKELMSLNLTSSSIKTIQLSGAVKQVNSLEGFYCDFFGLTLNKGNQDQIELINLIGKINNIFIRYSKINKLFLDLYFSDLNKFINSKIELKDNDINGFELNSKMPYELLISNGKFEVIKIISTSLCKSLKVEFLICNELFILIAGSLVEGLYLYGINNLRQINILGVEYPNIGEADADVSIRTSVSKLEMKNMSFLKEFYGLIETLTISKEFIFENLINKGDFVLNMVDSLVPISVNSSLMGNVIFMDCSINEKLKFHSSNIQDFKYFNTNEPEIIEIISKKNQKNNEQNAYRQLKISTEKSGNREKVNYFRSMELDAYYATLSFLNRKQVLEKITVGLNKFSNQHSLSWGRPLLLYGLWGLFTYFLFLIMLDAFYINNGIYIITAQLYNYLPDWFIPGYLYPSRNKLSPILAIFNYDDFNSLPVSCKLVVFVNDILVLPYLIYQFISAFRRHGMK